MRLLRHKSYDGFELVTYNTDDLPPYAILSHTWTEGEEVTYDELLADTGKGKAGYAKIRFCGERAAQDGLQFFWVDTCCIDKRDNTELTEAINSMFRWYQTAAKCYAYLSDVSTSTSDSNVKLCQSEWEADFRRSRWFTRGWTLQELLAPASVTFYSSQHRQLGDKQSLVELIHEITRIPISALHGHPLETFSVAERMTWSANRQTTKGEDRAYCLLGIFEIFMPLIYGEGTDSAFKRLQREVNGLTAASMAPVTERASMAKIHRDGFTLLSKSDSAGGERRALNVIFVHGLRGHPRATWSHPRAISTIGRDEHTDEHAGKHRSIKTLFGMKKSKGKTGDKSQTSTLIPSDTFWPEEYLVPDLPQARIWTYGYNADVISGLFGTNGTNSVSQHGRDLAVRTEREIENEDPILFVAHSLGGIIVKDAIFRSKACRTRTKLIVFLGTPHRGSHHAGWGKIAANLARLALQHSNKRIVETLEVNSEVLDNIDDHFKTIAHESSIKIHSFQEARGISGMEGLHNKVVDDFSSKLDLSQTMETVESMDANHMQMTRCKDRSDPQYRAICGVLVQFLRGETLSERRANYDLSQIISKSMTSDQVKPPHPSTPKQPSGAINPNMTNEERSAPVMPCQHASELHGSLYNAVRLGSIDQVVSLRSSKLSIVILNSALLTACLHGHAEVVRKLLEYGAHPESYNKPSTENKWIGGSALTIAASRHHYRVIDILLDAGSTVNGTRGGACALLAAIHNQKGYSGRYFEGSPPGSNDSLVKTVAVLLKRGADSNARDVYDTALGYCVGFSGTPLKVLDLLVQFGADVHDRSVLRRACGNYTTTKYLEWLDKQSVSFSATDDDSEPPFIETVKSGKAKKVKFFLDRKGAADLEWTNDSGHDVVGMLAAGCVHLYSETAEVIDCIMDSPQGKALNQARWKKAVDIAVAKNRMRQHTDCPQAMRIVALLRRAAGETGT